MWQIKVAELLFIKGAIIIDIRSTYSFNLGHIKGAISVPYYNLLNNYKHYLNRYDKYYLYCDTGEQSLDIATRLNEFGYDTLSVIGGYQEYLKFIDGLTRI